MNLPSYSALSDRCDSSLARSRTRRESARRARRRRLRVRGSGASVALAAIALALAGAGAALGQELVAAGSSGSGVSAVQRALAVRVTGSFDGRTVAAVKRFQRRHSLVVDGIVGPQTRGALGLGGGSSAPASAGDSAPAGLQQIAQCESGGNPRAVGGGGQYRGKYQFSRVTWHSVGGSGDPAAAPEAEQDRRAALLYARGGASSWPSCG